MLILIDGYNLIFSEQTDLAWWDKDPSFLEKSRDSLIAKLISYNATRKYHIIVAFDSDQTCAAGSFYPQRQKPTTLIEVVFPQHGYKADDFIINFVYSHPKPKGILVVTSDRQIVYLSKRESAKVISSQEFMETLNRPAKTSADEKSKELDAGEPIEKIVGLTPSETEKWMEVFGDEEV
ncbi:MAG: NYN domain-containing protein [Planctomycetes bacterium]|nr:NYN domain-containing protein [Planctomycetota bacterium]